MVFSPATRDKSKLLIRKFQDKDREACRAIGDETDPTWVLVDGNDDVLTSCGFDNALEVLISNVEDQCPEDEKIEDHFQIEV